MTDAEQPLEPNLSDTALIFEGGGMRAAASAPVAQALLENGIYFPWVGGISAGSSNTVNYLSRDIVRTRLSFTDFAADPNFGNLRTLLQGKGFFNADYIYQHTSEPDEALPFDYETYRRQTARLTIGAFNANTGETVYWHNEDMVEPIDMMLRVQASSTMPAIMPICVIDGEEYVDGALGVSGGVPLDAAIADGYEKFLVVLTRTRNFVKPEVPRPNLLRRAFGSHPAIAESLIDRPRRYNETKRQLLELEKEGRAILYFPEEMPLTSRTRNLRRLRETYEENLERARELLPTWEDFLS